MNDVRCLVIAKAPVPGLAKTRLGERIGMATAADLAACSLLDTLEACAAAFPSDHRQVALTGELRDASRGEEIAAALDDWHVLEQRGDGFPARLANAHADAGPGPVLQIGMDTPQLTAALLTDVTARLGDHDAVLGPAADGGWWVLALHDPAHASLLAEVPASTPRTGELTAAALRDRGLALHLAPVLQDVDTVDDASAVAGEIPGSRFATAWKSAMKEQVP